MQQEYLPRNVRIDWLRFQVESSSSCQLKVIQSILNLPFEKKQQQMVDVRDTNVLALNKVWHEVHEFQGSLIGVNYASPGTTQLHKYFVDLNGSTLTGVELRTISTLLSWAQYEDIFTANRIDIALDFPIQLPRLSMHHWELFLVDGLLFTYRCARRVSNFGDNRPGTTVYLGSRESECYVRIYDKNIDGLDVDRLEIEFKRSRADWIMQQIVNSSVVELPQLLNDIVCSQIRFTRHRSDIEFFKRYSSGFVNVPSPVLHLDIERSIAFIERHCATLAMVEEFMGAERYDRFMGSMLSAGKLRMKPRHRRILDNAKFLGVTALSMFLLLVQTTDAIASNLVCPTPIPVSLQLSQKFPIDIVNPTPAEQAYFDNIGDGCFQINSGLNFDRICLPGMIVNALKPFVIMGLGIKFIFSD